MLLAVSAIGLGCGDSGDEAPVVATKYLVEGKLAVPNDDLTFQALGAEGTTFLTDLRNRGILETAYLDVENSGILLFLNAKRGKEDLDFFLNSDPLIAMGKLVDTLVHEIGPKLFSAAAESAPETKRFLVRSSARAAQEKGVFEEILPNAHRYLMEQRDAGRVETVYFLKDFSGILIFVLAPEGRTQVEDFLRAGPFGSDGELATATIREVGPMLIGTP